MKLTRKEQRLKDYLDRCRREGREPTIGEICRDLRTTPWTLLKKTLPGLQEKGALLAVAGDEIRGKQA